MSRQYSPSSALVQEKFAFQSVSKNSEKQAVKTLVLDIFANCDMLELEGQKDRAFVGSRLEVKKFQVYYFSLSNEFSDLKGLVNGLISLGQPKGVYLQFQKDLNTYTFKFYQADEQIAATYLQKLIHMVEGEIRFKSVLKRIIANQKSFDASQQLLRKEIFN